ncbi:MAG: T9SS type A sorting domain-containing protein [Flavobacteriales bacterium]|nr:T9SS type A sorting domain-containing protein [Flavobacteriales bacterium]
MKRVYFTIGLLAVTGGLSAQRSALAPRMHHFQKAAPVLKEHRNSQGAPKSGGDVVFYEDFANGESGNNGVGAWTTSGANGSVWAYDTDGPNGDFSSTNERIQSTTVSNGFMIFDSNLFNNGCVNTNSCVVLDGYLVSPVLDLSATPNCFLSFEERLRWCCSNDPGHFVDISTDGGNTWPTRFVIATNAVTNNSITVNEDIGTHTRRFDISEAISADPSNVVFRFSHEGSTSGNITHYHWQVDDVQIVESHYNDLSMQTGDYDAYQDFGLTDNVEYNIYPYSQLRELNMRSRFLNFGSAPANATLTATVVNSTNVTVFDQTGSTTVPAHSMLDSITIDGFVPPAVTDEYDVTLTLTSDSADGDPSDNMAMKSFQVDPSIYAMDDGKRDQDANDNWSDNDGEPYLLGNIFWMENSAQVYAIQVCLASGHTDIGTIVDAQLLDENQDYVEATSEFEVTSASQLTGANQAKWITLLFDNPVTLDAGVEYTAVLENFGGSDVAVAISGESVPGQSLLYDAPNDMWFYTTSTPMVRLNFDPTIGIAESDFHNGVGLGQSFPNPAHDNAMIPYSLSTPANVTFEVHDLSGKLVLTLDKGQQGAGTHNIQLDTDALTNGLYFYTLTANDVRLTKRLSVVH